MLVFDVEAILVITRREDVASTLCRLKRKIAISLPMMMAKLPPKQAKGS